MHIRTLMMHKQNLKIPNWGGVEMNPRETVFTVLYVCKIACGETRPLNIIAAILLSADYSALHYIAATGKE